MRKLAFLPVIILIVSLALGFIPQDNKNGYVGVESCAMCHKTEKQGKQLDIWKNSLHARAYQILLTPEADKIAKEKGYDTPAAKTEACLKCHASGYDVDASLLGKKFKIEDGVQCETCHGAGSNYLQKHMKNKEEAIKNGFVVYENINDLCIKCHNPESPTYKELDFNEGWEKIKHYKPKN